MNLGELVGKAPYLCGPDTSITEAASAMESSDLGSLAVVEGMELLGLITERDIRSAVANEVHLDATSVSEIMSVDPDTFALMVVAALENDLDSSIVAYRTFVDLWSNTMPPLKLAHANAIAAKVLPTDHPEAIEAARSSLDFFTSHGFQAYLDLYADIFDRYRAEAGEVAV